MCAYWLSGVGRLVPDIFALAEEPVGDLVADFHSWSVKLRLTG
jgi:hypothetical protein